MPQGMAFSKSEEPGGSQRSKRHFSDDVTLSDLLALARRRTHEGRTELGARIARFLMDGTDLGAHEIALVDDILCQLLGEIERGIRLGLAEALANNPKAPPELTRLLAAEEVEIARPVLLSSSVLNDQDLLDLVNRLTTAHRSVIAQRPNLAASIGDALVEFGEEDVIEALLNNKTASLTPEALGYLVAESRRVERFRSPLLMRPDLPSALAYRMFWWVSAALRRYVLQNFDVPEETLDQAILSLAGGGNEDTFLRKAAHIVRGKNRNAGLGLHDLINYMREGRAALFIAAMAEILAISTDTARRLTLDPGGEGLALICRAAGIPAPMFRRLLQSLDETLSNPPRPDALLAQAITTYEELAADRAQRAVRFFDADRNFRSA